MTDVLFLTQLTGLLAVIGVTLYAASDVFLLASKVNLAQYPNLQPHIKLLSGTEKMVTLSERRRVWGGLLGVLATPLVVVGLWPLYYGLAPAGGWAVWPTVGLFGIGIVLAPFVHGTFIYTAEYVHALNRLAPESQKVVVEMFNRQKKILMASYAPVLISLLIGSIWFSVAVALGGTQFPTWMAVVNPITALLAWFGLRRIVPTLGEWFEGAGFNIALFAFFAFITITLWK
jgi:hypothetical protein